MVNLNRVFPLSALTLGAVLSYYGAYLLNSRLLFPRAWLFIAAAVLLWAFFLSLAPFALPGRPYRHLRLLGLSCAAGLALGAGTGIGIPARLSLGLPMEQITGLEGLVMDDPRTLSGGNGLAALDLDRAWGSAGGLRSSARGRVTVIFPGGRLEDLKEFGRKSRVYLEGSFIPSRSGVMFRASAVHIISPAPPLEQFRTGLRRNLVSRFSRPDNASWGSLSLALLLGVRDNLDSGFARSYRDAGISHVLALSGMHLAIFSALIALIFKRGLGPRAAAVLGALFILAYVFLIGSQPSLDRAAIMYLLGALAIFCSLARNPASLLNLAFLIQIIRQPDSGISISFILSYLALWGILRTGLGVASLLRGKIPPSLLEPLSASLGAFIATASVSAASFGMLQPAGILTGLVIVPLTSLFMVLSLGYLALDLAFPLLARPVGLALSLLYQGVEKLVALSAGIPGIVFETGMPGPALWVLILSLLCAVLIGIFAERRRLRLSRVPPLP
ncbi:MAG: ComEC/Rec2 family competence protein [Treponema sp.]|jgi:competence protein ComEC|nr:ComEC/Rec2 family competence protein [Treponema sp.]